MPRQGMARPREGDSQGELKRRNLGYKQLAEKLAEIGVQDRIEYQK